MFKIMATNAYVVCCDSVHINTPGLTSLHISISKNVTIDEGCKNLQRLMVDHPYNSPPVNILAAIPKIDLLTEIEITQPSIHVPSLDNVINMHLTTGTASFDGLYMELRILHVYNTTSEKLAHVSGIVDCPNIRDVKLRDLDMNGIYYNFIAAENLELVRCVGFALTKHFKRLRKLQLIDIDTDKNTIVIPNNVHELVACGTLSSEAIFKSGPNLSILTIDNHLCIDDKLEHVELTGKVKSVSLQYACNLKTVRSVETPDGALEIDIYMCPNIEKIEVYPGTIVKLRSFENMSYVDLDASPYVVYILEISDA